MPGAGGGSVEFFLTLEWRAQREEDPHVRAQIEDHADAWARMIVGKTSDPCGARGALLDQIRKSRYAELLDQILDSRYTDLSKPNEERRCG